MTRFPVLYEDPWLVVVNKPAGVLSHPNPGRGGASAFEGRYDFKHRRFESASGDLLWLIHRLDQETSGALLAARKVEVAQKCRILFEERRVRKIYLAVVLGKPSPPVGAWREHLVKQTSRGKVRSMVLKGRLPNAELHYKVIMRPSQKQFLLESVPFHLLSLIPHPSLSLLEITLLTGRTHQIRVQAASRGHPVLGDRIYGDFALNREWKAPRLYLHAWKLEFSHPVTGVPVRVESPLPEKW